MSMATADYDIVVVGAGFSGLYLLHRLRELGLSVRLLEAGTGVGGTWHWNRYPGARCDIESLEYQYQGLHTDNIAKEWEWSEKYATQPEILRYLEYVTERWDLSKDIDLNTRLLAAEWDDRHGRWSLQTSCSAIRTQFLIMATGCLSVPNEVSFKGDESFCGHRYHTASWPHSGVDFTGQRVAVIGTGSSSIQSTPLIAEQASELFVLQRTANYSVPAHNSGIDPSQRDFYSTNWDEIRDLNKVMPPGAFAFRTPPTIVSSALSVSPEFRKEVFEERWRTGGLGFLLPFRDIAFDPEANATVGEFVRGKIKEIVKDPEVASLLSPDFGFGCKRPCVDTGYYATFNRPNVHLVDIHHKDIEVLPDGVRVNDRKIQVDAIVTATGFDAMTGALLRVDIRGRAGQSLKNKWEDGPLTYLGLQAANFPNLFLVTGPGSPSVLTNMVVSIEQHVDWIVDCLTSMRRRGAVVIEAKPDAEQWWARHVADIAKDMMYTWGCGGSWYSGSNIPGKPKVFYVYPGGAGRYRARCDAEATSGYPGFLLRGPDGQTIGPSLSERLLCEPRALRNQVAALYQLVPALLSKGRIMGVGCPDAKPAPSPLLGEARKVFGALGVARRRSRRSGLPNAKL